MMDDDVIHAVLTYGVHRAKMAPARCPSMASGGPRRAEIPL